MMKSTTISLLTTALLSGLAPFAANGGDFNVYCPEQIPAGNTLYVDVEYWDYYGNGRPDYLMTMLVGNATNSLSEVSIVGPSRRLGNVLQQDEFRWYGKIKVGTVPLNLKGKYASVIVAPVDKDGKKEDSDDCLVYVGQPPAASKSGEAEE